MGELLPPEWPGLDPNTTYHVVVALYYANDCVGFAGNGQADLKGSVIDSWLSGGYSCKRFSPPLVAGGYAMSQQIVSVSDL